MWRYVAVPLCALLIACGDNLAGDTTPADADATPAPVVEAPATLTLVEGEAGSFTVTLAEDPRRDVTIEVASRDPATAVVATTSITLTSASYATGEVVRLTGSEDDDDIVNDATDIELSIDGTVVARVAVTVFDNDVQQIIADATSLTVGEGTTSSFTVRLARQPADPQPVTVLSTPTTVAAVAPATLTFSPTDYATPQTVTVTGVADADTANNTARIDVGGVSGAMTESIDVAIVDDDVQALMLGATTLPIVEGDVGSFTVALAYDPLTQVYVQLQSSNLAVASLPATVIAFDSTNYGVPQTVIVSGPEDANTTDDTATVTLSGPAAGSVGVTVADNDNLLVTTSGMYMFEGGTASLGVRLANDPGPSGRTVTITTTSGDLTVAEPTLTFTSANYATAQNVTLYAPMDAASTMDRSSVVRVASPAAPAQTPRDVTFTIWNRSPASLGPTFTHETPIAGAIGWLDVTFTLDTMWPADGRVVIDVPAGYDVSAATLLADNVDGALSLTATTSRVTLVRSGGATLYRATTATVRLGNIRNPGASGSYPISVATQDASGAALDSGTGSDSISYARLAAAAISFASLAPGATGNVTVTFTTTNVWPADGALEIYFPAGFDVSAVTMVSQAGLDGTTTASMSAPYRVRIRRSGGTPLAAGSTVSLTIGNITNPSTAQATTFFEVMTETSAGAWIDAAFPDGVVIGCPATITKRAQDAYDAPLGGDAWGCPVCATNQYGPGGAAIFQLESSDWLVVDDFGFAIPAGAAIAGVQFDLYRESTGWPVVDSGVRVVKAALGQTDRAAMTTWQSSETVSFGGATDLWGETWTAADVESSTFGVALAARAATSGMPGTVKVRNVTATVYLSCP